MKTSYQDDFQDPGDIMSLDKCRGKPYRYYDSNLHNGGAGEGSQFDGSTNYTESYIAWKDVRPPKSYKVQLWLYLLLSYLDICSILYLKLVSAFV